ncbi:MAG: transglutaminase-like domain-containing protein [archaeon]
MELKSCHVWAVVILVGIVLISGCIQEKECKVTKDCPDKTCFNKECIGNNCSYSKIIPCCGNGECDSGDTYSTGLGNGTILPRGKGVGKEFGGETYLTCPQDCPEPKAVLEENMPGIEEYPKLEQVFVDLYSLGGFTDSEMKYFKSLFDIFKSKTDLHQADEEVLAYLVTDTIEPDMITSKNYAMDLEYFVEELIPLANNITEGSSGDMESIEKIVSWVREDINVTWTAGYEIGQDTPKAILEKKEVPVHCDYWATLITALCRASGIPAREVAGMFGGGIPYPGGHAWTEAYVNGEWIMVDSTGALEDNPEEKKWLHTVYAYDPLNDRVMDVSLSYNTDMLDLIIEHTKEVVGETSATKQAEEIFAQYKKESDLANKYAYAQDIMEICISEIIAKQDGYEPEDIKVLDLWDWDKLIKEETFLNELEKAKVISIYDVTGKGRIPYMASGAGAAFPLEKINTLIPEIKQHFQGEIYFFFAHYEATCGLLSDAVAINIFDPEDVDTLETAYQDLTIGTPELLKNLVIEIASVASKEKNSTTFHLPEYIQEGTEYSITTYGGLGRENLTAFDIRFKIDSMIIVQNIMMVFSADQTGIMMNLRDENRNWTKFDNLKLINEEGKVYADPEIYRNPRLDPTVVEGDVPYNIEDVPSGIFIEPNQMLEIYREGDIVIIKGDMTTERIVIS